MAFQIDPHPEMVFSIFFSEPSLRLLLFIFNDEMKVQNYLVDISTPKPRHTIMFQIQTKLGSLKEQMELDLLTPFSKIRDGRAGSV